MQLKSASSNAIESINNAINAVEPTNNVVKIS